MTSLILFFVLSLTPPTTTTTTLSFVSWNLLADVYATIDRYPWAADSLQWPARSERLLERLRHSDVDVIALQELQHDHVATFATALEHEWATLFFRRARGKADGVALSFRHTSLTLLEHVDVDLDDGERGNVGVAAALRFRAGCVAVGTLHTFWDPRAEALKLHQTQRLHSAVAALGWRHACAFSVVLGDFNSLPDSAVVRWMVTDGGMQRAPIDEPTTVTSSFNGTIDHVFFAGLRLARAELRSGAAHAPRRPMPNADEPSDHFPLFAQFAT